MGRRILWDIRRKGRSLSQAEDQQRWPLLPEKIELVDGKFLCCDSGQAGVRIMQERQ